MPGDARSARTPWALLPVIVALAAHANTIPGDFVYDDEVLIEKSEELRDFDLRRIFLSNYWGPDRTDRNYRPLVLLTYALDYRISTAPWHFHVVNWLLNAGLAALVFLVLRELLGPGGHPGLAACGAALYAVLPVHVEAVANIVGRAEILAALSIFAVWLIALRESRALQRAGGHARGWTVLLASFTAAILGLLSKENAIAAVPLVAAGSWLLRRPMPWRALAGAACAAVAYLAVRAVVLKGKVSIITFVENPLIEVDAMTRAVNAVSLLGLYLARIFAPLRLSADYAYAEVPARTPGDPVLWLTALAVAAAIMALLLLRRRTPLSALSAASFVLLFAVTSNVLFPVGAIFGERFAFAPSFAYPLLGCAMVQAAPARLRGGLYLLLAVLVGLYAARSWVRNADWADRTAMYLRMPLDAPRSMRSHLKAAEAHVTLWRKAGEGGSAAYHLEQAAAEALRAREIYSANGKADAKLAEVRFRQGKYEESARLFARAVEAQAARHELDPVALRLQAECLLRLNRPVEAFQAIDGYIKMRELEQARPDAVGYNFRGLASALQEKYREALADFDRALAIRTDLPEIWNNRGMARRSLDDPAGAIEDWKQGLKLCREQNLLYDDDARKQETAYAFLLKMADAHDALAASSRAAGDEAGALAAQAEAAKCRSEAKALVPKR